MGTVEGVWVGGGEGMWVDLMVLSIGVITVGLTVEGVVMVLYIGVIMEGGCP